jgi:hypothetical protein
VNEAYSHKFKWKLVHMHPLPRQIRDHIAGMDIHSGVDQDIDDTWGTEIYSSPHFWVEEVDHPYIQHAIKCVILADIDDLLREELHLAFKGLKVEYTGVTMANDSFRYLFDFGMLRDRLCALLLRNDRFHFNKGQIISNVV